MEEDREDKKGDCEYEGEQKDEERDIMMRKEKQIRRGERKKKGKLKNKKETAQILNENMNIFNKKQTKLCDNLPRSLKWTAILLNYW